MFSNQSGDTASHLRRQTALRSRTITHSLSLTANPPLAEDLLYITQTHAEYRCQLPEAAMALGMGFEYLATQIVLIGSRHHFLRRRESPLLHYTIFKIALGNL
jgi:hypothetical protein